MDYLRRRLRELESPASRASTEPLAAWAERQIRLDGRPFSFEGHEYLRGIYDDTAPHVVVQKAAQVGGTVWALLRSFKACLDRLNVAYLFPTRTDVVDFSKSRVAPLIAENDFLKAQVQDTDAAGLKRVGAGYLYLRGMQTSVSLKSIPIDLLVFDELDDATPDAKALAKERLSHSDYKRIIELSNPSLPDYGIDEAFQASDQRHWTLQCPGCGEWTAPGRIFPLKLGEDISIIRPRRDGTGHYWACPRCEAELDLAMGEWVAEYPTQPVHGYRISQLFSSKVGPDEILHEYRTTRFPGRFYNLKIGVPWADATVRLTVSEVLACCGENAMVDSSPVDCTMGVDTGRDLHVVISRYLPAPDDAPMRREVVFIGVVGSYAALDELMARYAVQRCVIDALPEIHATRAFAERHPGAVWLNYFNEHQRGAFAWKEDRMIVEENRTEVLDYSRQIIRDRRVLLPRRGQVVEEFARHMAADAKQLVEDERTGSQEYRYLRTGADHYSLAFTYDCVAWQNAFDPRWLKGCYGWIG